MWFSNPPASDQLNRCGSRRTHPNPVVGITPLRILGARSILETAPRGAVPDPVAAREATLEHVSAELVKAIEEQLQHENLQIQQTLIDKVRFYFPI